MISLSATEVERRFAVLPITGEISLRTLSLPGRYPKDPVDRIIAATGRTFGYAVITRDGELTRYARAGHIELVEC